MPRFAANLSLLFTEYPMLERFAQARAAGFDAVEIQFPYELSYAEIHQALLQHQLKLILINLPAGDLMSGGNGLACVPGQEAAFADALQMALDYAVTLHVPRVNVLAGRQPVGVSLPDCQQTLVTNLRLAASQADIAGIRVVTEPINGTDMPRFLLQSMTQALALLEQVNHPNLAIQFDLYHRAMMGEDSADLLIQAIDRIGHIQFADWPGRHEPGTGKLDFKALFRLIDQLGYTGHVAAEYRPTVQTAATLDWFPRKAIG